MTPLIIVTSLVIGDVVKGNKDVEVGIVTDKNDEKFQFEKPILRMVFNDKKELQTFIQIMLMEKDSV